MTGGLPDDGRLHEPEARAHETPTPRTTSQQPRHRVVVWRVLFLTLVVLALVVGIVSLFYGGLPQNG